MAALVVPAKEREVPLCIDCDGTLLRTDLLHESVLLLLKHRPWKLFLLPWWIWLGGKAGFKRRVSDEVSPHLATLPLNESVLTLATEAHAVGRHVVLATASYRRPAEALAAHLGVFHEVLATEDRVNLDGDRKRQQLVERFGERGFDYAGNATVDLKVWKAARRAIVVSASSSLTAAARQVCEVVTVIEVTRPSVRAYLKGLRLHQWLKNLLVFVPVAAAHQWGSPQALLHCVLAFLAFGLCASSVYVLNDLLDLEADRLHPRKRTRPFASGLIPVKQGVVLVPMLLVSAVGIASLLPWAFLGVLSFYFSMTLAYSFALKRQVVVDVMMLAGLYTLRVVAGSAATGVVPSFWLLAFSMFIFLSLALVKRYSELLVSVQQNKKAAAGRGYSVDDLPVLMSAGTSSGMLAVLVFALYVHSPDIHRGYFQPVWLWLIPPLLLYWVSRLWMKTHRGQIDDDPVVFALRDWQSLLVCALAGLCFGLATLP